ncbi:PHGDH [Branchiostoma lanceolatum]|uniref:PHGDH protein n=1 Tax=Branchiostoma lanceolatum TaxID=7740 RepID=A0A8J9VEJ2_BRALA|nr:PHGDH [Branchiostoma lanceolatum]
MSPPSIKKILISDSVAPECKEVLEKAGIVVEMKTDMTKDELCGKIKGYDGLIVRSATKVTADVIEASDCLKIVGRAGTGVDNVDIPSATKKNVVVMNTPGGNTLSAAEHTCFLIGSLARQIPQAHMSMKEGRWDRKKFMGNELYGKTLGIIGLGRIGKEVALRMQAFGMTTIGFDPIIDAKTASEFNVEWMSLEDLWPKCDYITVHVPLIPQTANLMNSAVFAKCKKGLKVLNVSRGGIISETDLLKALDDGVIAGAAIDTWEQEPTTNTALVNHPNVIAVPHLGANTREGQRRCAIEIAEQIVDWVNGKGLVGAVNARDLKL